MLRPYERLVLSILDRAGRPMTAKEISDNLNMSWVTVKKTLSKLNKPLKKDGKKTRGRLVYKKFTKNKSYWAINKELLEDY